MKKTMTCFAVLALLISNYAYATTYTYTGENFTVVTGLYTTAMKVTGTFVTSSPIPPNSVDYDITGILVSWAFNDGVTTVNSTNGKILPHVAPSASTDGMGNITYATLFTSSSPLGTTNGDLNDLIFVFSAGDIGAANAVCTTVVSGYCQAWDTPFDVGQTGIAGVWQTVETVVPPTSVPTLPQWALILLVLGMVGITAVRRRV